MTATCGGAAFDPAATAPAATTPELEHPRQPLVSSCEGGAGALGGAASLPPSRVFYRGDRQKNTRLSPGGRKNVTGGISIIGGTGRGSTATVSDDRKKTTGTMFLLLEDRKTDPADLLDMQQRLRMTPSAMWGERANPAEQNQAMEACGEGGGGGGRGGGAAVSVLTSLPAAALKHPPPRRGAALASVTTAANRSPPQRGSDVAVDSLEQQNSRDRAGRPLSGSGKDGQGREPSAASVIGGTDRELSATGTGKESARAVVAVANKRTITDAPAAVGLAEKKTRTKDAAAIGDAGKKTGTAGLAYPPLSNDDGGERGFPFTEGATLGDAASLKRAVVTSSVPLRWQSRVVTSSSLQDHGGGVRSRAGFSASGKRRIRTKRRNNQRSAKKRYDHAGVRLLPS